MPPRSPLASMGELCTPEAALIGIDLAWGSRSRTGIAVLDAGGTLRVLESVRTDDEIDKVIAPYIDGPCLVGFDAPLHVVNPAGRRPCEAALSRAFAPQHAGAYPSNTGMAHFADGGRAARLARRYELDTDALVPADPGQRRALEVYPHSAAVALFDLDQVLKYKARPGRTLATRQGALDRLLELLAGLAAPGLRSGLPPLTSADGFASLRRTVAQAQSGAALRRIEDPIDAILCAYVARLFVAGRTCVIGDAETGAIVTPVQERHRRLLGLPPCDDHARHPEGERSQICRGDPVRTNADGGPRMEITPAPTMEVSCRSPTKTSSRPARRPRTR